MCDQGAHHAQSRPGGVSADAITQLNIAVVGRYLVERELGAGGMATVYLARDLKHERLVAIKVLSPELSATLASSRFLQEIRIAARLQHPHILGLIDSGQVGSTFFYVMPYVDGESLAARLAGSGRLAIADTVRILREVADALSHAHAQGVVHRDIKPDNVMLSGRHALIMDFGVAKALAEATHTTRLTTLGFTLGTPTYMAPEQAAAEPDVDHRADIYALGVMAYEMLCGQPPFTGMSPQQVVMSHISRTPAPVSVVRAEVSPALEQVVMRCLEKDPGDRFQSAEQLYAALEPHAVSSGEVSSRGGGSLRKRSWIGRAAAGAGIAVVTAATATVMVRRGPVAHALVIGQSRQLTSDDGLEIQPSISPNGNLVAYAAGNSRRMRIFIRPVAGGRTIALSDDSSSVENQPRWSPDGSQLLFLSRNGAYVSPSLGGSERLVAPGGDGDAAVRSANWSPDGRSVVLVRNDSLLVLPLDGGAMRRVGHGTSLHSCTWSGDGQWIACVSGNPFAQAPGLNFGNLAPSAIVIFPSGGGESIQVTSGDKAHQSPMWLPNESVLYLVSNREGPRDAYALPIGGDGHATSVLKRVTTGLNAQSISIASNRLWLAYSLYSAKANIWSAPIATGATTSARSAVQLTSGSQVIELLNVSPDGRWMLYDSDLEGHSELYRMQISGGKPERLTHDSLDKFGPDLSPDARQLAYHAFGSDGHRQLFVMNMLSGVVRQVSHHAGQLSTPHWSPDGTSLAAWDQSSSLGTVYTLQRTGRDAWQPTAQAVSAGRLPAWSPDGRMIAFVRTDGSVATVSADSGDVRDLYQPSALITDPRAETLRWRTDGKAIFMKGRDGAGHGGIWAVAVPGGRPRLLLALDDPAHPSDRPDFASDGKRFFFTVDDRQSDVWVAELKTP